MSIAKHTQLQSIILCVYEVYFGAEFAYVKSTVFHINLALNTNMTWNIVEILYADVFIMKVLIGSDVEKMYLVRN